MGQYFPFLFLGTPRSRSADPAAPGAGCAEAKGLRGFPRLSSLTHPSPPDTHPPTHTHTPPPEPPPSRFSKGEAAVPEPCTPQPGPGTPRTRGCCAAAGRMPQGGPEAGAGRHLRNGSNETRKALAAHSSAHGKAGSGGGKQGSQPPGCSPAHSAAAEPRLRRTALGFFSFLLFAFLFVFFLFFSPLSKKG